MLNNGMSIVKQYERLERIIKNLSSDFKEKQEEQEKQFNQLINSIDKLSDREKLFCIVGNKYMISDTEFIANSFFGVTNKETDDLISIKAQKGEIFLDPDVYKIFHKEKGTFLDLGANIGAFDLLPVDFCRDFVFFKDTPKYISGRVFGRIANNDGRIGQIIERLKNYEQWTEMNIYGRESSVYDYDGFLCFS